MRTHFLMALSSTPLSLSDDFCTQSYSAADDIVTVVKYHIYPIQDLGDKCQKDENVTETPKSKTEALFVVVPNWLLSCCRQDAVWVAKNYINSLNLDVKTISIVNIIIFIGDTFLLRILLIWMKIYLLFELISYIFLYSLSFMKHDKCSRCRVVFPRCCITGSQSSTINIQHWPHLVLVNL